MRKFVSASIVSALMIVFVAVSACLAGQAPPGGRLVLPGSARITLKVGDAAPPLTVTHWIKGHPFDIAKDGKGKIIILEFWATWCMPCIQMIPHNNEMNRRYKDKGVVFIALTDSGSGQTLHAVRTFVDRQASRMDYRVAYDTTRKTHDTYVVGSGAIGIPHAAVIGKDGRIAWVGHPGLPEMQTVVEDLILDRFDPAKLAAAADTQSKIEPLMGMFNMAVENADWDKGLSLSNEMLAIDPAFLDAQRFVILIQLEERRSPQDLRAWAKAFIKRHADNVEALTTLARLLVDVPRTSGRPIELVLDAARAAHRAGSQDTVAITTLARARYLIGDVDGAVRLQQQAVDAANILEKDDVREILSYYEACRRLGDQAKSPGGT